MLSKTLGFLTTGKGVPASGPTLTALFDVGWVLGLRLLRQALAVVVTVVLVRLLTQDEFGRYQFIVTMVGLCCAFTLPGMQRAIIQSVARGHLGTFNAGTRITLRFSLIGSAVLLAVAGGSYLYGQHGQALAFAITAVLFPGAYGLNQWQSLQIGKRDFRTSSIRGSVGVIGSSVAVMAVALAGFGSLPFLVAAAFGVLAVQNIFQQRRAAASVGSGQTVEEGSLQYGLSSSVWEGVNILVNWVDRLLLFALGSPHLLAVYAVADRIPEVIKANMNEVMSVLTPRFARQGSYSDRLSRRFDWLSVVAAVGIGVFAVFVVPWLIPVLYTDGYGESVLLCQLILASVAIQCFAMVKYAYIGARLDVASVRFITLWSAVLKIGASGVLVWKFGAIGAAVSSVVYRLVNWGLVEYRLRPYRSH